MGYFFRRSAKIGPFRLNFSKSGVGASVGVKGARLTMTPRGTTYITVGSHGFYYRETLSNPGGGSNATPASHIVVPATARPFDEIATADVSDLVDSSCETLIHRLNERAKMFNPAWLVYAAAAIMFIGAMEMTSPSRELPDVTLPSSTDQKSSTIDSYSMLVVRYGYPDSILASEPLDKVPVRTAHFSSAYTNVVFVPNGCVGTYDQTVRALAERSRYPALAKQASKNITPCAKSPNNGWTIGAYIDSLDNRTISTEVAKSRLDNITIKQVSPPVVEVESVPVGKQNPNARTPPNKKLQPKPDAVLKQTWTAQEQVKQNVEAADRRALYTMSVMSFTGVGLLVAGVSLHRKNLEKRTSRLFYELDETERQKYSLVEEALSHLGRSHRTWRIEARSTTSDWKRNAGASTLVRRVAISVGVANPPRVETNIAIPCINIGRVKLFFLPDVILYLERGTFGGIAYDDFQIEQRSTRFIEEEHVPADATVVDRTWRYVNKGGGPDRRFNNNVQLPVVQYGVLILASSRGLNLHLNTSNVQESLAFANCWRELHSRAGRVQSQSEVHSTTETRSDAEERALRVLGLNTNASGGEISAAYRHLAQMYHPDKVAGLAPEFQILADVRMKEINAAYEALKGRGNPTPAA